MKKTDIKNFMIVCNGFEEMFIVLKGDSDNWIMVKEPEDPESPNAENEFSAFESKEFDDDLVCVNDIPFSITQVYDILPIETPFNLCVKELYETYKPKLLWEREPTPVSKRKLLEMTETPEELMNYLNNIVCPFIIVD